MGYNAPIVVLVEHLEAIRNDPNFGQRLADAVSAYDPGVGPEPVVIDDTPVALVLDSHPSDLEVHIAVGGDAGYVTGRSLLGNTGYAAIVHRQDEADLNLKPGWMANSLFVAGYLEGDNLDYQSWPLGTILSIEPGATG